MPELLKLFDLYMLPSLWEGLPMVLLEAMAAGCPIVATNVGGNPSIIQNGYNGSLIEPGNPDIIASEIIKVLSDKKVLLKYANNSRNIFRDKFSAQMMTRKYENLYMRMC